MPLVGTVIVLVGLVLLVMAAGGLCGDQRDEFGRPGHAHMAEDPNQPAPPAGDHHPEETTSV